MSQIQYSLTNNIFIARLSGRFNWNISKSKISVVEKHPVVEIGVAGLSVFFLVQGVPRNMTVSE